MQRRVDPALRGVASEELVARARQLDARLMAGGDELSDEERARLARQLIDLYDTLQDRIERGQWRPHRADDPSPLAGLLDDLPPFGNRDQWQTMARPAPRARRAPRRPERASEPERGGGDGGGGGGGGGGEAPRSLGTPRVRSDGELLPDDGTGATATTVGQGADIVGGIASGVELAADIAGLASVTFFAGIAGLVTTAVSYAMAIVAAHAQEVQQARLGGLRISALGLDVLTRDDYRSAQITGRQLYDAGLPLGEEIRRNLQIHCTQLPDREIDREMLAVATALGRELTEDLAARTEELYRRAAAEGATRAQVDRELPRIRRDYLRRVHALLVPRIAAATRAATGGDTPGRGGRRERPVQRVARGDGAALSPTSTQAVADRGVAGGGEPLPHLDAIQASFGHHDVTGVRAHTGGEAAAAAGAIGARAYATGDDVAFAGAPDLHTAAHEAAHVVQQRAGVHLASGVGQTGDVYERHADAVADAVVRGEPAEALLDQHAGNGAGGVQRAVQRDPGDRRRAPRREPRTRDGRPVREGDVLIPGATASPAGPASAPDPDTHVEGAGGAGRNASTVIDAEGQHRSSGRFAPEEGARPPLNPYEGMATDRDERAPLFDERGPNYDDPQQGVLGDCYLIAALSAVAQMDPGRIRRMISPLGDGRYSVTFWVACVENGIYTFNPHQEIVTNEVPISTLGRDPAFSGTPRPAEDDSGRPATGQRELWVSLVERAYAQWRGGFREAGDGGLASVALAEITGTASRTFWKDGSTFVEVTTPMPPAGSEPRGGSRGGERRLDAAAVLREIEQALRGGAPVTAGTSGSDEAAAAHGLFSPHGYSVLWAGGGAMLVRNPHRDPTRGGRRVRVDAAVLAECFSEIAISGARSGGAVQESPANEDVPSPEPETEPEAEAEPEAGAEAEAGAGAGSGGDAAPASDGAVGPVGFGDLTGTRPRRRRRRAASAPGGGGGASAADPATATASESQGAGSPGAASAITIRTAAPSPGHSSHNRTTVGVGEHVTFTAPGGQAGGWTASAGRATTGSGTTFRWIAPSQPTDATITFGGGTSVTMRVIAPTGVRFRRIRNLNSIYAPNQAGAAMGLEIDILPHSVSFGAIYFKELGSGSDGAAHDVTGYFATSFSPAQLRHDASPQWTDILDTNRTNTGANIGDTAGVRPGTYVQPWSNGGYAWHIPYAYRVQGESGEGHRFTTVTQTFRIRADGTVTVSKGGQSISRTPSG